MNSKSYNSSSTSIVAEKILNLFTPYSEDIRERIIAMKRCGYEGLGIVFCNINDLKNVDLIHNVCSKEGVTCLVRFHLSSNSFKTEPSRGKLLNMLRRVRDKVSLISIELSLVSLLKVGDLGKLDIVTLNLPSIRLLQKYIDKVDTFELLIDDGLLDVYKIGKFIPIIKYLISANKLIVSQNISNTCIPPMQLCMLIHGLLGLKHVDCRILYKKPLKLLV